MPCNCSIRSTIQFDSLMQCSSAPCPSLHQPSTNIHGDRTFYFVIRDSIAQAFHFALLCSCPPPLMTSSGTSCDGLSHWLLSPGTYIQIIPTRSTIDAEERLDETLCSCQRRFASTCAYVGLAKTIEAHCEVEETAKNETRKIECTFPFKLIIMAKLCLFAKGGDVGGGTCTLQYTFKFYETCKNQSYYSFRFFKRVSAMHLDSRVLFTPPRLHMHRRRTSIASCDLKSQTMPRVASSEAGR